MNTRATPNGGNGPPAETTATTAPQFLTHSGSFSSLLSLASPAGVSKTCAAAVDRASQLLPSQWSSGSLLTRRRSSQPPPLLIAVRLLSGEDVYLTLPPAATLAQLRESCVATAGVAISYQRLLVEEDRPAAEGLASALRNTASQLTSREKIRETVVDWVNFIFLPEAVNREVRGRGITSWAREHVLRHLRPPPPPHIAQVTIVLLGGRRIDIELSSSATLLRLQEAVERTGGVPSGRQRIVIAQQAQHRFTARLILAAARRAYFIGCGVLDAMLAWARWVLLGEDADASKVMLQLRGSGTGGGGGGSASMAVRGDMTVAQLQQQLQLSHGDEVTLEGLVLGSGRQSLLSVRDVQQQQTAEDGHHS